MKPTKLIFCFTLHGFSCMQTIQVKKNVLQKEASGQGNCAVNCMCTAVALLFSRKDHLCGFTKLKYSRVTIQQHNDAKRLIEQHTGR